MFRGDRSLIDAYHNCGEYASNIWLWNVGKIIVETGPAVRESLNAECVMFLFCRPIHVRNIFAIETTTLLIPLESSLFCFSSILSTVNLQTQIQPDFFFYWCRYVSSLQAFNSPTFTFLLFIQTNNNHDNF